MESTSQVQETQQAYGPHRPTVGTLTKILASLPEYYEVHAIAINGQTGRLFVEVRHEDMNLSVREFSLLK